MIDASTKKYVDDQDALKVSKSGDTMSGELNIDTNKITSLETPMDDSDASTKKCVDDSHSVDVIDTAYAALHTRIQLDAVYTPLTDGRHFGIQSSTLISPKKIIKLNLSHFARYNTFNSKGHSMVIWGRLKNFTGYVNNCVLVIKANTSNGLLFR